MQQRRGMQTTLDVDAMAIAWGPRWPESEIVGAGTVLFREGGDAREIFWVIDGVVKLVGIQPSGAPTIIGLRQGRSLLGPFTARSTQSHPAGAIAIAPTRFYRFGVEEFHERLGNVGFIEYAWHAMHRALEADLGDHMRAFLRDPAQRLLAVLSTLVDDDRRAGDAVTVLLPGEIDFADLAALVQVTPVELHQLISGWGRRGYVRRNCDGFVFCWTALNSAVGRQASPVEPRPGSDAAVDARVRKAIALIDEGGYAKAAFGIRDLSRHVNLSPWYLSRLLKRATGKTFRHLLNMARIERARLDLLTTHLSIKEIAARVGYLHQSDLTRHFRLVHRLSPSAYREQARNGR
jgi:AraC-like DNA-binding protein/CRP-like cAMP-binding protein